MNQSVKWYIVHPNGRELLVVNGTETQAAKLFWAHWVHSADWTKSRKGPRVARLEKVVTTQRDVAILKEV